VSHSPKYNTIAGLPNNRKLAGLLGDLTVAWSHAERIMYFAFWVASGTTQVKAFDIYESMSGPKNRLDITLALFEQDKPDHPKFESLIQQLKRLVACGQIRNELVHRTWVSDQSGNLFLLNHRMTKRVPEAKAVDEAQIEELLKSVAAACDGLLPLIIEIFPQAFSATNPPEE
jgi:hypothetical protein